MSTKMFLMNDGKAVLMEPSLYEKEDVLQKFIADNTHLLLRNSDPDDAVIMLVEREESVGPYSLDHLMVDQDGTPILVEVKRSSDHRIHREVAAQMLDYASRAAGWDVDQLRAQFKKNNEVTHPELVAAYDTDEFWEKVSGNLSTSHLRLAFVADQIPSTLRILIEFLDTNMPKIDVYGVDVKRYRSGDTMMLVAETIESTTKEAARIQKEGFAWDIDSFKDRMQKHGYEPEIPVLEKLLQRFKTFGLDYYFGQGPTNGRIIFTFGTLHPFHVAAHKYAVGVRCPFEFSLKKLLEYFPSDWTEEQLAKVLAPFDFEGNAKDKTPYWITDTKESLYVDLKALRNEADFENFCSGVQMLVDALRQGKYSASAAE